MVDYARELLPHLFRQEFSKMTAVLCRRFGLHQVEIAEDIVSETFLVATEVWSLHGVPENPTAWVYTVAKNKTRDYLRRKLLFEETISTEIKFTVHSEDHKEIDLSDNNIKDSQLQMIFAVCHPRISPETQIALALRLLCGFGTEEIAHAFLANKETIKKRITRGKEQLREEKVLLQFPPERELTPRLESVLRTLYLLFNEGYYSRSSDTSIRKELCIEAMRLTLLLTEENLTNKPEVHALIALMCFQASRLDARINSSGEAVIYEEQNHALWNQELIEQGTHHLIQSQQNTSPSKYHLEAAIAFWHTREVEEKTKWENILNLYNQLLIIEYSPAAALNRTFALSKVYGSADAILEAEKLNLKDNPYYESLLGELYSKIDPGKAAQHFTDAANMLTESPERRLLIRKANSLV